MRTSLIITLDCLLPKISYTTFTVLTKADIDQEITKLVVRLKVRRCLGRGPLINRPSAGLHAIPTAKLTSSLRFVVEGCTEGYDPFYLPVGCKLAIQ